MKSLLPFALIGLAAVAIAKGSGTATHVPVNYQTQDYNGIVQPYQPLNGLTPPAIAFPKGAYSNGYTTHDGTVIGDMIHQMTHEGAVRSETLNQANDILSRCVLLAPPKPPACG